MTDEQNPRKRGLLWGRMPTDRTVSTEADNTVPLALRVSAAYAWRLLLIAAAAGVIIWVVIQLKLLV
ncbi:MAG: AI-2E family transporter, partial [Microbacteriaceae bacterium]